MPLRTLACTVLRNLRMLIPISVLTERIVKRGLVAQQFDQFFIQLRDRVSLIETESFACGVRAITMTIPDFALQILLAAKQYRPGGFSRNHHQHRFRLGEAAQVIKAAVVAVGIMGITVARDFRRGGDDGDAVLHAVQQTGAALNVWGCAHGALCCERTCLSSSARRFGVPTSTHKPW